MGQKLPNTGFGHSTPLIIHVRGKPQMLVLASGGRPSADALQSLDPADGTRLWWCQAAGDAASPAYGAGIVYFDSGRGGPGAAIDPTGNGDVAASPRQVDRRPGARRHRLAADRRRLRLPAAHAGRAEVLEGRQRQKVYAERLEGIYIDLGQPDRRSPRPHLLRHGRQELRDQGRAGVQGPGQNDLGDGNHPSPPSPPAGCSWWA